MRSYMMAFAGWLLLSSSLAEAQQPPAAPQVTLSANLKELVFDWDPVPGAYTYWLLEKPYNNGNRTYFTPIQDRIPASRTRAAMSIAVHQFNWWENRYIIAACNTAGCTRSAEIDPIDVMLDSIGYLKASNSEAGDAFGSGIAMSADGTTLAVSAPGEDSAATGVNGDQASNASANSGAVYVFRRTGRSWAQEAYLKAGVNRPGQALGAPVDTATKTMALSADGAWLAVGAPAHDAPAVRAGVVYLFRRDPAGWSLVTTLQAASPSADDQFGFSVDMSHDGRTLKVSSLEPTTGAGEPIGRTHLYVRPADTWQHSLTLAPWHAGERCPTVRMATNGETLLASCRSSSLSDHVDMLRYIGGAWVQVSQLQIRSFKVGQQMALDHHATRLWIWEGNWAYGANDQMGRYHWENGAWVLNVTQLGPNDPSWPPAVEFDSVADSGAWSDIHSSVAGAGPVRQNVSGGYGGAVYMYRFIPTAIPEHQPRGTLKAPNPDPGDEFGAAMAFSGNGRIFAVGAPSEDSAARGIDGDRTDNSALEAGAVYLY